MDLAQLNERLSRHFTELHARRVSVDSDRPVFALEHGLNESELRELSIAIRTHAQAAAPLNSHALAWIVYAAELGYRYSGDEYWQTFEAETPGWAAYGDRYWIRNCFRSFHTKFGGAVPSGRWAEHFSIICWPITHAILPRDLQQQLARILYEVRHSFSAELFESPKLLGEFIATRSWNATSRFQNLVEERSFVGQIAAALLLQGDFGTDGLIHPATLRRIGDDLDRERRGREWLRSARRFAQERAQVRGLAFGGGANAAPARNPAEARAEVTALGIEPRLVLRPIKTSADCWEVSLEIPDLSHLILRFPGARDVLAGSRCVVAGAAGRPLARGRCLHGPQRVALSRWPHSDEVLLQFEQTDPQLEYLLRTECLLRPGPRWLFRIASDGLAYEARSLRVRPGGKYVVIDSAGPIPSTDRVLPVAIACEGVYAATLELPEALTADWEQTLKALELTQAKSIEVWPAGLAAVVWDGEGHGEWLASERPCLAIRSDHAIGGLSLSLGPAQESLEITSITPGEPVFVELPPLPVGLHRVRVAARAEPKAEAESIGELDVVMRIREARPWSAGVSPHGPLSLELDPTTPTLEQLWEDRVELAVRGPVGRRIKCRVYMYDRAGASPILTRQLPPVTLPLRNQQWRQYFDAHLRRSSEVQNAYDNARICELEFSAEELGAFTLRCEREFTPLRWTLRRVGQRFLARLHEDVGSGSTLTIGHLDFATPTEEERLETKSEYDVPTTGGLYVARMGEFQAAIISPPVIRGLEDLRCVPRITDRGRSVDDLLRIVELTRLWDTARLPGDPFSAMRQRVVLRTLTGHIFRILGGEAWADAEASATDRQDGLTTLKRFISKKQEYAAIGATLALEYPALSSVRDAQRVERLASVVGRFLPLPTRPVTRITVGAGAGNESGVRLIRSTRIVGPDDPGWLAELALRLASDPAHVEAWAGEHFRAGVARLLELSTLARAARFLVIATDRHLASHSAGGELYAGWSWS